LIVSGGWERGSPEPLVGYGELMKEERLWGAALPAKTDA
jgi:hypothetical protein